MKAKIELDPLRRAAKVWLYQEPLGEAGAWLVLRYLGGGEWMQEDVSNGAVLPEPTFLLPIDALEALVQEASDFLPPSSATERHLEDATEVRDRLLTIVERSLT